MDPVASIRRLGFRKWYERQLIDSHLCLVTCLLCGITVVALIEEFNPAWLGPRGVTMLGVAFGAIVLGVFSWRRYMRVLQRAELYGEKSICVGCATYGRFEVLSSGMDSIAGKTAEAVAPLQAAWMQVKCKRCGLTWRMPD